MISLKEKYNKNTAELKGEFDTKTIMAVPKITKVVVSSGTGRAKDKKRNELVSAKLALITGQKASKRAAKQSIATFKLREGDIIGFATTLRGERMHAFLDKLINVAFPRMRDFRGIDVKAIDEMGNLTIGIRENTIFPETSDEDLKDVFGFSITIVTDAKSKEEAEKLLKVLNFPFKKQASS